MNNPVDLHSDHFFSGHFLWLKIASVIYILALIFGHLTLGEGWIWTLAVFFSVAMNFTYPWGAIKTGEFKTTEFRVSGVLIVLSFIGLIFPPAVIAAIFLHGVWDYQKSRGAGVPFFRWYVGGCVVIDGIYSLALSIYWFQGFASVQA